MRTRRATSDCRSVTCARSLPPPMRSRRGSDSGPRSPPRPVRVRRRSPARRRRLASQSRRRAPDDAESKKGRGRKRIERRPIPIPPALAMKLRAAAGRRPADAALLTKAEGERWQRADHVRPFALAAAQAGHAGITSIALRHSHIIRALLAGVPIRVVAALWTPACRCWSAPTALTSSTTPTLSAGVRCSTCRCSHEPWQPCPPAARKPGLGPARHRAQSRHLQSTPLAIASSKLPAARSKTLAIPELRVRPMTDPHMTFIEAVAWIATRDSRFSDKCRDMTHRRLAVSLAIRKSGGKIQHRRIDSAEKALMAKCRVRKITATGLRGDISGPTAKRRTRITDIEWVDIRGRVAEDARTGRLMLAPKAGDDYWHEVTFTRAEVLAEFPVITEQAQSQIPPSGVVREATQSGDLEQKPVSPKPATLPATEPPSGAGRKKPRGKPSRQTSRLLLKSMPVQTGKVFGMPASGFIPSTATRAGERRKSLGPV